MKTIPFREHDQIVTLFTHNQGIVKLVVKGSSRRRAALSPLTRGEFLIVPSKSELWKCIEIHIVDTYPALRQSLERLEGGADLLKIILETQMSGKPAPLLYQLLISYIHQLKQESSNPRLLIASFKLKLLRHEGLLHEVIWEGNSFAEEEIPVVQLLAFSRSWVDLKSAELKTTLEEKIKLYFKQIYDYIF